MSPLQEADDDPQPEHLEIFLSRARPLPDLIDSIFAANRIDLVDVEREPDSVSVSWESPFTLPLPAFWPSMLAENSCRVLPKR